MKNLLRIVILFFIFFCEKIPEQKIITYDFSKESFKTNQHKSLRMLNVYDVITIEKVNDSILHINLDIFKGWKVKGLKFSDTLKLTDNIKKFDTLGNQTEQVLTYSKDSELFFQLHVYHQPTNNSYNYEGKLFIENSALNYFCDHLYVK